MFLSFPSWDEGIVLIWRNFKSIENDFILELFSDNCRFLLKLVSRRNKEQMAGLTSVVSSSSWWQNLCQVQGPNYVQFFIWYPYNYFLLCELWRVLNLLVKDVSFSFIQFSCANKVIIQETSFEQLVILVSLFIGGYSPTWICNALTWFEETFILFATPSLRILVSTILD